MDKVEDKWNRIYSEHQRPGRAAAVLTDNSNILPVTGVALDLACGLGSNSLFLAARGLEVHAWDISTVAISCLAKHADSQGLNIQTRVLNITASVLPIDSYDLIVISHYLDRTLPPAILNLGYIDGSYQLSCKTRRLTRAKHPNTGFEHYGVGATDR